MLYPPLTWLMLTNRSSMALDAEYGWTSGQKGHFRRSSVRRSVYRCIDGEFRSGSLQGY